jgi:hypothetical protein
MGTIKLIFHFFATQNVAYPRFAVPDSICSLRSVIEQAGISVDEFVDACKKLINYPHPAVRSKAGVILRGIGRSKKGLRQFSLLSLIIS